MNSRTPKTASRNHRRQSATERAHSLAASLRPRGPVHFEVSQKAVTGGTMLDIEGEVDLMTAPKLAAELDRALRTGQGEVSVDLCEVSFLDSAGLHVLLNAARRLTRRSRRLRVICGPGPVRHVIELARLVETLNVADPDEVPGA